MDASIPATSGIYRIVCITTGKFYLGSTINLCKRRNDHFSYLRRNAHTNPKLQLAWNKHTESAFVFEIIELVLPQCLLEREQYWLDRLKPSLNIASSTQAAHLGLRHTPESRALMSANAASRGKPAINRGKSPTPEAIEKNRQAHLGRKASPATREKMRLRMLGNTINLGRKHTSPSLPIPTPAGPDW